MKFFYRFIDYLVNLFMQKVEKKPVYNPLWYSIALEELGQSEILGNKHNQRIVLYHSVTTLKATDDETPWCSSFVCWCLEKAGIESSRSAAARSYLKWGKKIDSPIKGCICVFSSPDRGDTSGHVGFYVFETDSDILVLGGNQFNKVSMTPIPKSRLLGYRLP